MNHNHTSVALCALASALLLVACQQETTKTAATPAAPAQAVTAPTQAAPDAASAVANGSTSNCLAPPFLVSTISGKYGYTVPADIALTRQADANCFAWQEFIALNWIASTSERGDPNTAVSPSSFGTPNDQRATVWETYKESDEVFLADAKNPGPWNYANGAAASVKVLGGLRSEVGAKPVLDLSSIGQASQGSPWLTAQSKILTLYERRMNEDEYNYIVNYGLYNANVQQTFVQKMGINLPDGTPTKPSFGTTGSIETKAAWLELPNPADWPRFKISKAIVTYPNQAPKTVVVGLTGLHIIHKTALGQQFIWATFEHKQNVPDVNQVSSRTLIPPYTYYNVNCNPNTDYYKCVANANPSTYKGGQTPNPYNAPIQAVRQTPIASRANDDVVGLNQYVWSQVIAKQNPNSVFLNYQLVNTLWSNQNTTIPPGSHTPLIAAQLSPGPSQEPVANATMETYVQSLTCLDCHASAPIATVKKTTTLKIYDPATAGTDATKANPFASDYSFLLGNATQPKSPPKH